MTEITDLSFGKLKVSKLLGHNFFIPNYQRGYRWEKQQVIDLLDDLKEFIDHTQETEQTFYCLQPIVVKLCDNKTAEAEGLISNLDNNVWYEVIDGQQRLTTLFILLSYLQDGYLKNLDSSIELFSGKSLFDIEYETRKETRTFLHNFDETKNKDNIDCYYIWEARQEIKKWFGANIDYLPKFLNRLVKEDKCNIEIIWYRVDAEDIDNLDPISTFNRINIGKIPLTNAELIKALFLLKHYSKQTPPSDSNMLTIYLKERAVEEKENELKQIEISKEWDAIEAKLHDEELWAFLNKKENLCPARIEYIFQAIYKRERVGNEEDFNSKFGNDNYATFRYFNKKFEECGDFFKKDKNGFTFVDNQWNEIKKNFAAYEDWYNDSVWFHYVGFLIWCGVSINTIFNEYADKPKNQFTNTLIRLIKEQLSAKAILEYSDADGLRIKTTDDKGNINYEKVTYKDTGALIRKLLLLYNIEYLVQKKESYTRFPFKLFKDENWDIEHIDSQTLNELNDKRAQDAWILGTISDIEDLFSDSDEPILTEEEKNKLNAYVAQKNADQDQFNKLKDIIEEKVKETRNSSEIKDCIGNLTLLSSKINRSYGNAIFPQKRKEIIEKESEGRFVPICTKNVFLKNFNSGITKSVYWTENDIQVYTADIIRVLSLNGFVVKA